MTTEPAGRIEELLAGFAPQLGRDAAGYGNHVRRVFGLVRAQGPHLSAEQLEQVAIAAVFHDIGIWLDGTFDYLQPSQQHAAAYLGSEGLHAWEPQISALIQQHHKLRPVRGDALVEAFRRADLCDVSLGLVHRGIQGGVWAELRSEFPIEGFHMRLLQLAARQVRTDPLRPLPMLRW